MPYYDVAYVRRFKNNGNNVNIDNLQRFFKEMFIPGG